MPSRQKRRKRRMQIQARNASVTPVPQNDSIREDGHSQGGERSLPEDIWGHIHSLTPLRDSARSACVSRTFLRSWRCHPNLTFTEEALGLELNARQKSHIARTFTRRVDHILRNHSGIGVKKLRLAIRDHYNVNTCHLNSWLQNAITPGIEEVDISLPTNYNRTEYNFPCSILLNGCGNSIRYLRLTYCAFRPTVAFDCLRNLTKLHLCNVHITGNELGYIFSGSFGLEELKLVGCNELICLKIPFWLERFSYLKVYWCKMLQVIESTAPNLSTFDFMGGPVQLSLGESSQVKNLHVGYSLHDNIVSYAITRLPSIVPHLETLTISSIGESVNTPIAADKFLHLKYLKIFLACDYEASSPAYDYLSSASFLDVSPVLETFILSVKRWDDMVQHDSDSGEFSHMRQVPEHKHDKLKNVLISGFYSAKNMVNLTCHILEKATSLGSLTLDTIFNEDADGDISRCCVQKTGECIPISRAMILEAHKALSAVKRYILGRVPSTVKLNVGEPCSRCHAIDVKLS